MLGLSHQVCAHAIVACGYIVSSSGGDRCSFSYVLFVFCVKQTRGGLFNAPICKQMPAFNAAGDIRSESGLLALVAVKAQEFQVYQGT